MTRSWWAPSCTSCGPDGSPGSGRPASIWASHSVQPCGPCHTSPHGPPRSSRSPRTCVRSTRPNAGYTDNSKHAPDVRSELGRQRPHVGPVEVTDPYTIRHAAGRLSIADACPACAGDLVTTNSGGYAMSLTHESTTVEAWFEWFATEKQP